MHWSKKAQELGVSANKKIERQGAKIDELRRDQRQIYYEIKDGDKKAKRLNRNMFYTIFYEPLKGRLGTILCCFRRSKKENQESTKSGRKSRRKSGTRESIRLSKYASRKTTTDTPRRSTRTRNRDRKPKDIQRGANPRINCM